MADSTPVQRKLAAILAADVAGYSRLMGADEEGTLARLKALRANPIDPAIAEHHGRIVKTTGDGMLVEFASVVDAMRCAIQWQAAMAERTDPESARIEWRIGVNLGDVIIDGDDIFGDGVNIAARLEAMTEPGGICISHAVVTQTRGKLDFPAEDLGEQALKNIARPVHVFRVGSPRSRPNTLRLPGHGLAGGGIGERSLLREELLPEPPLPRKEGDPWSLTLFGGVTLSLGERTVVLRNRKSQAILGYIALSPSHRATREQLAGLLWSESPEAQARASLRQAVRGLRQVLDAEGIRAIVVGRDDTSIAADRILVDVWTLLGGIHSGDIDRLLLERKNITETLLENLDDLDPAFRSWLLVQRQSLHERLVFVLETRLAELEKDGGEESRGHRLEKTIALALVNLDPTHEGACRQLMLASAREGDVSGALRRYNNLWDLLDNDHDVEPSAETQQLVVSIKTGNIAAAVRDTRSLGAVQVPQSADPRVAPHPTAANDRPERRLRIMMGPFEATGVDPEQRYLVSGFRHQLISSLVRFREWSLIDGARTPIFAAAAQEATYVVTASAYQAQKQLQLVLTLSDVMTGEYVWSEDVSADLATWFSTQKLVVRRLAIALNVHLSADRLDRTLGQPDVSLALYDRWLHGEALMAWWRGRSWTEAAGICRSIIAQAPNFAPAYCTLVNFINSRSHLFPGEVRTSAIKREALDLARTAVELDPTFSRTHLCAAWSYALNGHYEQAELSFEMAYELNENDPWTLIASSLGIAFCGSKDVAARRGELALQLGLCVEPRHWGYQAVIRFLCEDYQGCVNAADQSQDAIYNFAAWKAAALTHLGRHDAARAEWRRFVCMVSNDWHGEGPPDHDTIARWLLQGFPIKSSADWERLRDGIPRTDAPTRSLTS